MAGNAAREGELLEQPFHAPFVLRDIGIHFAVGPFQVGVRHNPRPAMAGPGNIDHVEILFFDDAVEMHVDEVQSRRRPPMTEQPWLDMSALQRLLQQGIVVEINLPNG